MRAGWTPSIVVALLGAALAAGCAVRMPTPTPAPVAPTQSLPAPTVAQAATIPAHELEPTPYAGGSGSHQIEIVIHDYAEAQRDEFGGASDEPPGVTVV